jgi:hypothetical protein
MIPAMIFARYNMNLHERFHAYAGVSPCLADIRKPHNLDTGGVGRLVRVSQDLASEYHPGYLLTYP